MSSTPNEPGLAPPPPPGPTRATGPTRAGRRAATTPYPVTPGSVAPVGARVLAYALDVALVLAVAGLGYAVGAAFSAPWAGALGLVVAVGQWIAEARTGATVGNAATGIRTLATDTGRPAGLRAILVRQLVVALGALVCLVGQWVVVASGAWDRSPAQRGWHDRVAGTLVLRARAVRRPVPGPSTTAAWSTAVARAVGQVPLDDAARLPAEADPAPDAPTVPLIVDAPAGPRHGTGGAAPSSAIITGLPGAAPSVPVAREASPVIDVPSALVVDQGSPVRRGPGLITGPRPDRTGSPLVRPADPGLGELERLADAPVVRPADPGLDDPEQRTGVHLRFDTGEGVDVTGDGLIGRSPAAEDGIVHVVAIDDPDRSISKVHLAFGLEPDGRRLWVLDRGSTNGTVLVRPDGASAALPPGTRAVVEPGWIVRFGRRSVVVEDP